MPVEAALVAAVTPEAWVTKSAMMTPTMTKLTIEATRAMVILYALAAVLAAALG